MARGKASRGGGGDESKQLSDARRAYQSAKAQGNRSEEARWANVIGHILKNRRDYAEALKWLRIDYEVSSQCLAPSQRFAACQSMGELYLLRKEFRNALHFQKQHLELAKDEDNLVEQQRASTQLGRTYHDMLVQDKEDHSLVRSAKKYFKSALELAWTLKENPPANDSSFLREYIDAHNNMGMLEMDLDNYEGAKNILIKGLDICIEEEFPEVDPTCSRLHHTIGSVYMELKMWKKAREHMEMDIQICNKIGHCEGEAKGFINLGILHYKNQRHHEAIKVYKRALSLARTMEDNGSLVEEIDQNIATAKDAIDIMDELEKEEQNLKRLIIEAENTKGSPQGRKLLLKQYTTLDCLIEKARTIEFWSKLYEFGEKKKMVADELRDKEKLGDSFSIIGEACCNLRKFDKASKWYTKSWETYKLIGNLEGQAMAKIDIGNVLDSVGDSRGALDAYKESYRIATGAKIPSTQLSALENMHYIHLMRFDDEDEARRLQLEINKLKKSRDSELERQDMDENFCSETETEGGNHTSDDRSDARGSRESSAGVEEMSDNLPLTSLLQFSRRSPKATPTNLGKHKVSSNGAVASPNGVSISASSQGRFIGRKRSLVISDDEDETYAQADHSKGRTQSCMIEDVATSDEFKNESNLVSPVHTIQHVPALASKCTIRTCDLAHMEESCSSHKSMSPYITTHNGQGLRSSITKEHDQWITIKIEKELIHVEEDSFLATGTFGIESVKVELACLYYLQLPVEKRAEGLLPIIQHIKCCDKVIETLKTVDTLKDHTGKASIEACVDGWVQKRLIKHYIEGCKEVSEIPNMKLLKKLYDLEVTVYADSQVSDDEITVSDCELQDLSITPLLNALHAHKTFALLDLSHNLLGNGTMEKLQQVFTSSGQKYGGLTLDLHCNLFGSTALVKICECPSLFSRLEVLNISGNRITDSCASCLTTILQNCQALCSLNVESCSITSRTILKVADALNAGSVLEHLCIGHNNPISGNSIVDLLGKLLTLKRFSKLSLNGLKLSKPIIDSICQLAKSSCLLELMLAETGIGNEAASLVTESLPNGNEESVKLHLSYCRLTSDYVMKLNADVSLICCLLELNLAGNPIAEGSNALSSLLLNPQCCLKVLVLEKCQLGVAGMLEILQALAGNTSLEDLNLSDNTNADQHNPPSDLTTKGCTEQLVTQTPEPSGKARVEKVEPAQPGLCPMDIDLNQLEVADSEEDPVRGEAAVSGADDSASSCQRNTSSHESRFASEISTAIGKAENLQLLDLSNNGFTTQTAEILCAAWSTSRSSPANRHFKDGTIHLLTKGRRCCVKPCCKKD